MRGRSVEGTRRTESNLQCEKMTFKNENKVCERHKKENGASMRKYDC